MIQTQGSQSCADPISETDVSSPHPRPWQAAEFKLLLRMSHLNRSLKQTMLLQTPNKGVSVEQYSSIFLNREFWSEQPDRQVPAEKNR